jgi:exosortase
MEIGKRAADAIEPTSAIDSVTTGAEQEAGSKGGIDWSAVLRSPALIPGAIVLASIVFAFWPLIVYFPQLWLSPDGYYSHGFLVPLIIGFIIYKWWPHLKSVPVKGSWIALLPLLGTLYVARVALVTEIQAISSLTLVAALLFGIAFVAGWHWMWRLSLPTLYLVFALPLWTMIIDNYTNRLQLASTEVSYWMLKLSGFDPYRSSLEPTTINLNNFTLDVAVPCSGLKLVLALAAFATFFMMIANLRWWANALIVALLLPFAVIINGLRVGLIGVVGDRYGSDAGMAFHDYSGYITLLVCFYLIFKFVRLLGWKD